MAEGMVKVRRFYVYTLARPNGRVFYVGKGQGDRMHQHERLARTGWDITRRGKTIREILRQGDQIIVHKVFETNDEEEAYGEEKRLVAMFGRDALTNETNGGKGGPGTPRNTLEPTPEYANAPSALVCKRASEIAVYLLRIVHYVGTTGARYVFTERGRPVAALVPIEDLQKLERLERQLPHDTEERGEYKAGEPPKEE